MWEDRVAVHVRKDMLKSQMWRNSCIGEFILVYLAHTVYICFFFRFGTSPKNLFVSCNYHVLFVCVAHMVFMVNTANIQYSWIFLDIQIMQDPLCTAVLTIIFFRDYSNQKYGLFFSFVGLMLWLKVCVAFTDLQKPEDCVLWMQNEL